MLLLRIIVSGICLVALAHSYREEPYHTLKVPFSSAKGGQISKEVFIEFYSHTVLTEQDVALRMTVLSSEEVSMSVDKCGKRLFETSEDIKNATYLFTREWIDTILTGIYEICTVKNEYQIDITIDCKGPCNGTIIFSISNQQPENIQDKKSNPAEGSIPFATSGDSVPVNVSSDIGLVIEAAFMNPSVRVEIEVEYSTPYTMVIGKCGLTMLRLEGNGELKKHNFGWDETKLLRLVKATQCPGDNSDTIDYVMSSEKAGSGTLKFSMMRHQSKMDRHPANMFDTMELARGVPKHHPSDEKTPTQSSNVVRTFFVLLLVLIGY